MIVILSIIFVIVSIICMIMIVIRISIYSVCLFDNLTAQSSFCLLSCQNVMKLIPSDNLIITIIIIIHIIIIHVIIIIVMKLVPSDSRIIFITRPRPAAALSSEEKLILK